MACPSIIQPGLSNFESTASYRDHGAPSFNYSMTRVHAILKLLLTYAVGSSDSGDRPSKAIYMLPQIDAWKFDYIDDIMHVHLPQVSALTGSTKSELAFFGDRGQV